MVKKGIPTVNEQVKQLRKIIKELAKEYPTAKIDGKFIDDTDVLLDYLKKQAYLIIDQLFPTEKKRK